jgi:hypothetical protein
MMRNMRIKAPRRPSSLSKTLFLSISRILSPQPIEENYTPKKYYFKEKVVHETLAGKARKARKVRQVKNMKKTVRSAS